MRIDGNHRLEPFDEKIEWWYDFLDIPDYIQNETDDLKKMVGLTMLLKNIEMK